MNNEKAIIDNVVKEDVIVFQPNDFDSGDKDGGENMLDKYTDKMEVHDLLKLLEGRREQREKV